MKSWKGYIYLSRPVPELLNVVELKIKSDLDAEEQIIYLHKYSLFKTAWCLNQSIKRGMQEMTFTLVVPSVEIGQIGEKTEWIVSIPDEAQSVVSRILNQFCVKEYDWDGSCPQDDKEKSAYRRKQIKYD
jgi:hypothetical protein